VNNVYIAVNGQARQGEHGRRVAERGYRHAG
jgi:hypothetical protein